MDHIISILTTAVVIAILIYFYEMYRQAEDEKQNIETTYDEFDDGEKYSMAEIEQACSKASKQAADVGINLKLESEKRQQQFKAREFLDKKTDSKPYYKNNSKP